MIEGWKQITVNDLGKVVTGNTPPKKDPANYGGKYPFIKPTDMDIDRRHVTTWEENYSEKAFKRYHRSYIPPKATGVVTIGTVGEKIFQADQWCFTNQSVNVVIPNEELYDPDFVFYILKINLPKVENANPGTASGRHHVSKSNFCAIKIWVPESKDTQRKIAGILSAYDDLIENNLKRIKLLEEKAQLTYEEWFVRMKFPGYEDTPNNAETGLPEGWSIVKLEQITTRIGDGLHGTPKYDSNGSYYFVNGNNLENGNIGIKSSTNRISESEYQKIKKELNHRSILVAINGTLGNIGMYSGEKIALGKSACYINIIDDVSKLYVRNVLESQHFQAYAYLFATGSTIKNLGLKAIRNYKINLPHNTSQNNNKPILSQYDELIEPVYQTVKSLQNQNQLLKEARDLLLPRLMTGMIDVDALDLSGFEAQDVDEMLMAAEPEREYK